MIRGILFDLDNTLLDFMRLKQSAVDAAVSSMIDSGLPMEHGLAQKKIYELYDKVGIENQEIFNLFLEKNFQTIEYKWLASAVVAYRRARDGAMVTYPHVRHTLTELLRRHLRLAVISDAPRLGAWLRLCHLELQHMFDPVITFEDTGHHKPSSLPFAKALDIMGMGPDEVLMVGDWPERDMVGAKGLGIKTVFARYGDTKNTVASGADYEIDDISELLQILDHLETDLDQTDLFEE
ncbi:HAD-IA family hydrolase [bacterium]|nr:HAD-IA family hydrolase [bacterium]MBU1638555.1 HAD-IA family hydrolase [bacterium]MBU1920097.1 HAD-IA family hydrolase [bacterium]